MKKHFVLEVVRNRENESKATYTRRSFLSSVKRTLSSGLAIGPASGRGRRPISPPLPSLPNARDPVRTIPHSAQRFLSFRFSSLSVRHEFLQSTSCHARLRLLLRPQSLRYFRRAAHRVIAADFGVSINTVVYYVC